VQFFTFPLFFSFQGPVSKYQLKEEDGEERKGVFEFDWVFDGEDGIACSLESEGVKKNKQIF